MEEACCGIRRVAKERQGIGHGCPAFEQSSCKQNLCNSSGRSAHLLR